MADSEDTPQVGNNENAAASSHVAARRSSTLGDAEPAAFGSYGNIPQAGFSGTSFEKLEGSNNFHAWKFAMKMSLKLEGLWPCIQGTNLDPLRDERALARICLSVKPSCYQYVREAGNAKAAWESLASVFESKGLYKRVLLLRQLHRAELGNSMSEYIDSIMSLVHQLADIGKNIEDGEVAEILLSGLTMHWYLIWKLRVEPVFLFTCK